MNIEADMLNEQKVKEFQARAAQFRRSREPDVQRRPGFRKTTAGFLRRAADAIDLKQPHQATRIGTA